MIECSSFFELHFIKFLIKNITYNYLLTNWSQVRPARRAGRAYVLSLRSSHADKITLNYLEIFSLRLPII